MASLVTTTVNGALTIDNGSHAYQYFNSGASAEAGFFLKHNGSNTWEIYKRSAATKDFAIYDFGSTNGGIKFQIPHDGTTMALMAGGGTVNCGSGFSYNDTTRLLTITNSGNAGGINLATANVRIYFGGTRAIEGTPGNASGNLTLGEGYSSGKVRLIAGSTEVTGALTGTSATFSGSLTCGALSADGTTNYIAGGWTTIERTNTTEGNSVLYCQKTGTGDQDIAKFKYGCTAGSPNTGTDAFVIHSTASYFNSSVGIGTTDPGYLLDVNGTTNLNGALTGTSANFTAFNLNSSSAWLRIGGYNTLRRSNNFLYLGGGAFSSGLYTEIEVKLADGYSVRPYSANATASTTLGTASYRWPTVYGVAGNFSGALTGTTATFSGTITADGLAVGTTSNSYTQLLVNSSTTGESELRMGDTDTDAGSIAYTNSDDTMTFRAAAAARMSLSSSGLAVTGTGTFSGALTGTSATFSGDISMGGDMTIGGDSAAIWKKQVINSIICNCSAIICRCNITIT